MINTEIFWEKLSDFCNTYGYSIFRWLNLSTDMVTIQVDDDAKDSRYKFDLPYHSITHEGERLADYVISDITQKFRIANRKRGPKNMKAFICGPTKGHPKFDKALFDKTEKELIQQGFIVFNPAWMDFSEDWSEADKKAINLAIMARCDAVYPLPGWFESDTCRVEVEYNFSKSSEMILLGKDSEGLFYRIRG